MSLCQSETRSSNKCSKCPQQQLSKPARRPHRTSSVALTFDADRRDRTSVMVSPTESRSDWAELAEMQYTRRTTSDSCMLSPEHEWSVVGSWDLHGLVACKVISTRQQNSAPVDWSVDEDAPSRRLADSVASQIGRDIKFNCLVQPKLI